MFWSKEAHLEPDQMTTHSTAIYFLSLNCILKKSEEQNPFTEKPFIDFWLKHSN